MPKYIVEVPEFHISIVVIEAETPQDAIDKIKKDADDELVCMADNCFYVSLLNATKEHEWVVKDENDNEVLVDCG